jgi:type IV pilus assembly protein PilB
MLDLAAVGMGPKMLNAFGTTPRTPLRALSLVTGPTRLGQNPALYSCINALNDVHTCIVTAEEPVEYVIEGISVMLDQPQNQCHL